MNVSRQKKNNLRHLSSLFRSGQALRLRWFDSAHPSTTFRTSLRSGQVLRLRWFGYAHHKSGQAMIILVMFLGATMLGITTIAGFITLQKIRTVTDIVDSTKAIYAADAGIEWWLYNTYSSGGETPQPTFSNESSVTITDISENEVRSVGNTHRAYRAFGLFQN